MKEFSTRKNRIPFRVEIDKNLINAFREKCDQIGRNQWWVIEGLIRGWLKKVNQPTINEIIIGNDPPMPEEHYEPPHEPMKRDHRSKKRDAGRHHE